MSGKQIHLSTGDESTLVYQISEKNMAVLLTAIEDIVAKVVEERMRLATEAPMDPEEARKFLGLNISTLRLKTRQGIIPSHELELGGHKFYYASEINEKIKGKKK